MHYPPLFPRTQHPLGVLTAWCKVAKLLRLRDVVNCESAVPSTRFPRRLGPAPEANPSDRTVLEVPPLTRLFAVVVICLSWLPGFLWPRVVTAQEVTRVVKGLNFEGNNAIDDATLSIAIATTNSSWFARTLPFKWFGLGEKRTFNEQEFRRDVLRIELLYRMSGYLDAAVDTVAQRDDRNVKVRFLIKEGKPVRIVSFEVTGLDSIENPKEVLQDLPLREGQPLNRILLQTTSDSIVRRLRDRGYPYAVVFRDFVVDKDRRTATVKLQAEPGTHAVFGPIRVEGTRRLDSTFTRKLLSARPGDEFSQERVFQSQRNLYNSELFRFATVEIDSAALEPGAVQVPILVRVTEGKFRRIRGSWGFGTDDCFRVGLGWTARNFLGGGRVLDLTGRLSKIGVGDPLDFGARENVCYPIREDTIGSRRANYNLVAAVRKPNFLSPQNTATYSIFAERRSEFKVYRREEVGTSFSILQETTRRIPLSLTYRVAYGKTTADPANFCAFFNVCLAADIDLLSRRQFLGTLTFNATWQRANNPLDPTRGSNAFTEITHSSRLIGSSSTQQFNKLVADAAWYRQLKPGVVFSWHLRGGLILSPKVDLTSSSQNFVPPEQRFYAGGPNDVRGFYRNELGPVVYVLNPDSTSADSTPGLPRGPIRVSATGGNTLVVGNAEIRVPSPIFGQRVRLAVFVDAGSLSQRGQTSFALRITPGAGIRVATPLGPVRLDAAYNSYRRPRGTLYQVQPDGGLNPINSDFDLGHAAKVAFHFSVGQPF